MDEKVCYNFNVNGFDIKAEYFRTDIENIFIPLMKRLGGIRRLAGRRLVVFLAGPPGCGKTTLSLYLEKLALDETPGFRVQAAGIDGFHYSREYLEGRFVNRGGVEIPMREVRGSAETYDFEKLTAKLEALSGGGVYWPVYDRNVHDPVDDAGFIDGDIVIIEGNWLLLDEPGWRDLKKYCGYGVFVESDAEALFERLVGRKVAGGLGRGEAENFVKKSDFANIKRARERRLGCDLILELSAEGRYRVVPV